MLYLGLLRISPGVFELKTRESVLRTMDKNIRPTLPQAI